MTDDQSAEFAYTLGLICGEGSFFVAISKDPRYRHGVCCTPKFAMTMGEYTETMLKRQRDRYDLGTVNESSKGYQWVLSSREDCHALRDLIDGYLERLDGSEFSESPKFESYQAWCDALEILQPGTRLSKADVLELARIRTDINYVSSPSRLSVEEIQDAVETAHRGGDRNGG
jgi:hypothetical protein